MIEIPSPNPQILSCQSEILPGLPALAQPEALVSSEEKRRAFETDGLTARRRTPLAVVLPARIKEISCSRLMHRKWCQGRRGGDLAGRFRRHWRFAIERCLVRRLYQPDRTHSGRHRHLAIRQHGSPADFFYAPVSGEQNAGKFQPRTPQRFRHPCGHLYLIKDVLEGSNPVDQNVVKYVDRCPLCISCMTTCSFPRTGRRYPRYGSHRLEHHTCGSRQVVLGANVTWLQPCPRFQRQATRLDVGRHYPVP